VNEKLRVEYALGVEVNGIMTSWFRVDIARHAKQTTRILIWNLLNLKFEINIVHIILKSNPGAISTFPFPQ
jgi:hypothetical protein